MGSRGILHFTQPTTDTNMRAYFFGNMYLSSIQQGIQAAHATHELFTTWTVPGVAYTNLHHWATEHKTMVLLNGGYAAAIQDLVDFFAEQGTDDVDYPWADVHEEEASLNGALTTVGIILPEKIYAMAAAIRRDSKQKMIRSILHKNNGLITVDADNSLGITVDEPTILYYTPWELQLIDKLNKFSLAT